MLVYSDFDRPGKKWTLLCYDTANPIGDQAAVGPMEPIKLLKAGRCQVWL